MPTARELLEHADALMRRSRDGAGIPVLLDVVEAAAPSTRNEQPDIPVLTEEVDDLGAFVDRGQLPPKPLPVEPPQERDPFDWLTIDTVDPATHSVTGEAPDTLEVVAPPGVNVADAVAEGAEGRPASALADEQPEAMPLPVLPEDVAQREAPAQAPGEAAGEPSGAEALPVSQAAALPDDEERWRTLADQISMQVLQRVDLFTDAGLKDQLAQHLRPIVARAGTELVDAINEHVGKLLRAYVAEAIEREIVQWRREHD